MLDARRLGGRIKKARQDAGLSQHGLAKRIAKGDHQVEPLRRSIMRWENGKHVPNAISLAGIAEATGRSPEFFLSGAGDDEDPEQAVRRVVDDFLRLLLDRAADKQLPTPLATSTKGDT